MILRTLHIDTEQTWRGGEQQVFYLMRGLQRLGHGADLICQPDSPLSQRADGEGMRRFEIRMVGEFDVIAAVRVARIIESEGHQVVHLHTAHAHSIGLLTSYLLEHRPRYVVSRRVDFRPVKGLFSRLKYGSRVDRYIAITQAVKDVMVQNGISAEKIAVVHSATDVGRFESVGGEREEILREFRLSEHTFLIGNVAACVGHKGQDYLLSAMPTVFSEFPNAVLFIVGDGPLRGELEASARKLKISDRVIFTGMRDDVPRFLHAFDLFVLPSWGEGMGSVLLEAMAARKPVVATDADGIIEVVQDRINGLLVPTRNAEALACGIGWMLRHRDAARAMGEAGRRTVEEWFTADRMVEGTLAVYDTLVRRDVF